MSTLPVYVEHTVTHTQVHDRQCFGCQRHKLDVMLTVLTDDNVVRDVFFTTEQAEGLLSQLTQALRRNNGLI